MTPEEFNYVRRAVVALEGTMSPMERIKVQRTMAQILEKSAEEMEKTFMDRVDQRLANAYLVDVLKK